MNPSQETMQALRQLLDNDPALQAQVRDAGSDEQATAILMQAAREHGIDVKPQTSGALSDEQLDAVAGAGWFDIRPLTLELGRGG